MGYIDYSFSKLDDANYCLMRYYLRWIERAPYPNPPFFFKGRFFHSLMENFWERLGTSEEVAMSRNKRDKNGKKYSSNEEFADYVRRQWIHDIIQNKNSKVPGNVVNWDFKGQEFLMAEKMKEMAYHFFNPLIGLGKPLYQEKKFEFVFGHRKFRGRIDAIRFVNGKILIDDYKSGSPWIGPMKINHDPQMSMYNVGLAAICSQDENFAESLGLKENRNEFLNDPAYLVEEVENRFVMVEAPAYWARTEDKKKIERVPLIHSTSRKREHFYDGVEKSIEQGIIYPERGRKCDGCVMKKACEEKLEDALRQFPQIRGQGLFAFVAPIFTMPSRDEDLGVLVSQEGLFKKGQRGIKVS
ncbi:MAG: PD-(D/E)XK nuclease family protein [Nanoarchaeota archaeon]